MTSNDTKNDIKKVPWEWIKAARDVVKTEPRKLKENATLPVELLPWLYLSDMPSVFKLSSSSDEEENNNNNPLGITAVLTTNKIVRDQDLWGMTAQLSQHDLRHGYVGGVDIIGYDMMKYHWDDAYQFISESLNCENNDNSSNNNNSDNNDDDDKSKEEPPPPPKTQQRQPKIVIHCQAGTNRSALIAGAAMIEFGRRRRNNDSCSDNNNNNNNQLTFLEVISILKKQRGFVLNNVWFIQQLAEFAQQKGQLGPKPIGYTDEPLRKSEMIV